MTRQGFWRAGSARRAWRGLKFVAAAALAVWSVGPQRVLAASDDGVVQSLPHGRINWTTRTLEVTGRGAPNFKEINEMAARPGALRLAEQDACTKLRLLLHEMHLTGTQLLGEAMAAQPEVQEQVHAWVCRAAKVVETRYYADGGVDVMVEARLDAAMQAQLLNLLPSPVDATASGAEDRAAAERAASTGVVAVGDEAAFVPAAAPRLLSEAGVELFGPSLMRRQAWQDYGMALYTKSLETAVRDVRVADRPLLVRAVRPAAPGSVDWVLSAEEVAKLTAAAPLLAAGRIVFVLTPK